MKIGLKVAGAVIGAVAIAFVAAGCASTGAQETREILKENESGVTVKADNSRIVDWSDRTMGESSTPSWMQMLLRKDYNGYMEEFGIENGIIRELKFLHGTKDLRGAQARANLEYGRSLALELNQSINVYLSESLTSGNINQATRDAIGERTKQQASAQITGHQVHREFWQEIEEDDPRTGKTSRHFLLWRVYVINADAWAATTAKYIKEVIGDLPRNMTLEEQDVQDMLNKMMYDARHPVVMTQQQVEDSVRASRAMLEVELEGERKKIDLMGDEMKNNRDIALAKIVQDGKTERAQIKSDTVGGMVDAALISGDPVLRTAASISPADAEWVRAMELATSIVFQ